MSSLMCIFLCITSAAGCLHVHWEGPGGGTLQSGCEGNYEKTTEMCDNKPVYNSLTSDRSLFYDKNFKYWKCVDKGLCSQNGFYEILNTTSVFPIGQTTDVVGTCLDHIAQWTPDKETDVGIYKMADGNVNTCYDLTAASIEKPLVIAINRMPAVTTHGIIITIKGATLNCMLFSSSCSKLALQVFARPTTEPPNERCAPICGNETLCYHFGTNPAKSECRLKCLCPPRGCKEIVVVMNSGMLPSGGDAKVCEIGVGEVTGWMLNV